MAQGKHKPKGKLPGGCKTKGHKQKKLGPKRGGKIIAPKKTKQIEAAKLKKGLEKAIKANIEHDISMKAKSVEPKHFRLIKASQMDASSSSAAKSSKTNKK